MLSLYYSRCHQYIPRKHHTYSRYDMDVDTEVPNQDGRYDIIAA